MLTSFENVEEAKSYERLPEGCYVAIVQSVKDFPREQYVEIEFDIAEGEYANHFAGSQYPPSFRWYYTEKAAGIFKSHYIQLGKDNPQFDADKFEKQPNEKEFIGCKFGLVVGTLLTMSQKGEPKEREDWQNQIPVDCARKNDWKIKEPRKTEARKNYDEAQAEVNSFAEYGLEFQVANENTENLPF